MKSRLFVLSFFILFIACEKESAEPNPPEVIPPKINSLQVNDIGNQGNGADLTIDIKLQGDLSRITVSKVLFAENSVELDTNTLSTISETNMLSFEAKLIPIITTSANLVDIDGQVLQEDVDYKAYVYLVSNGATILSEAISFKLENRTVVYTFAEVQGEEDIAINGNGELLVCGGNKTQNTLFKVRTNGTVTPVGTSFQYPVGCTVDEEGNVYVSNFENTTVQKINAQGVISTLAVDDRLSGGGGLTVLQDGSILNAFFSKKVIYKISPEGEISELLMDEALNGPIGMTYNKEEGIAYIANFNDGKIFEIQSDNTLALIVDTPLGIGHVSYANQQFFVTGPSQHIIQVYSITGELLETIGTGNAGYKDGNGDIAEFLNPNGIEARADGQLIYISGGNDKIRAISRKR